MTQKPAKIAVIMGSQSDWPTMQPCVTRLEKLGIPIEVRVMSAHRTPELVTEFSLNARQNGFGVIIAAAGKAAHLAGVVAAHTTLPVIGVPIKSSTLDGLDALLSTVQMPPGIPVATVTIDGSDNAALLAASILSVSDEALAQKLDESRKKMQKKVEAQNEDLQRQLKQL